MTQDIIRKLKEVQEKENKRRNSAVRYLEKIEKELTPIFQDILGEPTGCDDYPCLWIPKYNKDSGKFESKYSMVYFRYYKHITQREDEYPGFYIDKGIDLPVWGISLTEIKGKDFWFYLKQITDWIVDYLPQWIENHDKSRDQRFEVLEKIHQCFSE